MNYILQLNAFMEKVSNDQEVKTPDRFVYVALFYLNNLAGWREKFFASYSDVMNLAGLSAKDTYYKSLQTLQDKGFIKYYPGRNRYEAPSFTLLLLYQLKESKRNLGLPLEVTNKESRVTSKSNKDKLSKPNKEQKLIKQKEGASAPTRPSSVFQIPTIEEIRAYMITEKNFHYSGAQTFADKFWNGNNQKGWLVGKNRTPMKNWHSAVATWLSDGEFKSFIRKEAPETRTENRPEVPGEVAKPAPTKLGKDEQARQTYGRLLQKIKQTNEFSTWEIWDELYLHLTNKGRTQKIPPAQKNRIREKVRAELLREAEAKALNSSPALKSTILAGALQNLDYHCKKQFCIEYFTRYIKTPKQ